MSELIKEMPPSVPARDEAACDGIDGEANSASAEEAAANKEVNEHNLGKFKNPQELLRAYGELEKEFTRRSQRLKELEKATQPVNTQEQWKSAVDKFFNEIPSAKPFAKDMAGVLIRNPELQEDANCLGIAFVRVLADKFRTPEQLIEDGQFLNEYVLNSQRVKDAVIAQYLQDIRSDIPPRTMRDGGLQCVAPGVKPKTIQEAGFMFLKDNR